MNLRTAVNLLATPRASDGEKGGPNQCNSRGQYDALPGQVHASRFQKYQAAVDRWTAVYGHEPPTPTLPDGRGGNHRLNPAFSQWMMGAMHVHLEPLDRKQRLQAIGNAVQPQTAHAAYSQLLARKDAAVDILELTKLDNHLQQEIQNAVHRGDWDGYESHLDQWREVDTALAIAQHSGDRG